MHFTGIYGIIYVEDSKYPNKNGFGSWLVKEREVFIMTEIKVYGKIWYEGDNGVLCKTEGEAAKEDAKFVATKRFNRIFPYIDKRNLLSSSLLILL